MHSKAVAVHIGGKEHHLLYTLNALITFTERFGGLDEMVEATQGPAILETDTPEVVDEKRKARKKAKNRMFAEMPWLIAQLANQGMLAEHIGDKQFKIELLTPDVVGLLVMPSEYNQLAESVMEAIVKGSETEHTTEDEETDIVLEEIERKNAEGAAE